MNRYFGMSIILWLFLSGCVGTPAPTAIAPPRVTAAANLRATAESEAGKIVQAGTAAGSPESVFVKDSLAAFEPITGPGKVERPGTALLQFAKSVIQVQLDAALEREREHAAALAMLRTEIISLRDTAAREMLQFKFWSILVVGGFVVGLMAWAAPIRAYAPFAGIGFGGLATVVLLRFLLPDIYVVAIAAALSALAWGGVLYLVERRKAKTNGTIASVLQDAIEAKLPEAERKTIAAAATKAGVQAELHAQLVDKGYAT